MHGVIVNARVISNNNSQSSQPCSSRSKDMKNVIIIEMRVRVRGERSVLFGVGGVAYYDCVEKKSLAVHSCLRNILIPTSRLLLDDLYLPIQPRQKLPEHASRKWAVLFPRTDSQVGKFIEGSC